MEILCFSANIQQCNIAYSVAHVQVCFKSFFICYQISFLQAMVAATSKRICVSAWFERINVKQQLHTQY